MPDTLNKQAIVNLLIDSPLREPIKINLIDIVNNTNEPDLPKVYSTIVKELEIFQKATERRMKLADETIAKLNGTTPATTTPVAPEPSLPDFSAPQQTPAPKLPDFSPTSGASLPPLDLPPLPSTPIAPPSTPVAPVTAPVAPVAEPPVPSPTLTAATLDLPPMPQMPSLGTTPTAAPAPAAVPTPNFQPLGATTPSNTSDEDALAEIQKELDSLKSATASEISSAAAPAASPTAPVQQ